jgi:hypothetical protein
MLVHVEQETDFIVLFHNVYCFWLLKNYELRQLH